MILREISGHGVAIQVCGYQFPDDENVQKRYSWHMVQGQAHADGGDWAFRYPALTCDETPMISTWLRTVAAGGPTAVLRFTEPNLELVVAEQHGADVTVAVGLDMEFLPPWRMPSSGSVCGGGPFVIAVRLSRQQLLAAADEWDAETEPFPDGLAAM